MSTVTKPVILGICQQSFVLKNLSTEDMVNLRDFPFVWFQERIKGNEFGIADFNLAPYLSMTMCMVHDIEQKNKLAQFISTNLEYNTQRVDILHTIFTLTNKLNNRSVSDQLYMMSNDDLFYLCTELKLYCDCIEKIPRKNLVNFLCKILPHDWNWVVQTDKSISHEIWNIVNNHDTSLFDDLYKEFKELIQSHTKKNLTTKIEKFNQFGLPKAKNTMIKFLEMNYNDIPVNIRPMIKDSILDMETDLLVDLCQRVINIQNARNM